MTVHSVITMDNNVKVNVWLSEPAHSDLQSECIEYKDFQSEVKNDVSHYKCSYSRLPDYKFGRTSIVSLGAVL